MNTVRAVTFAIIAHAFCIASPLIAVNNPEMVKAQILTEMEALQAHPDSGIFQKLLFKIDPYSFVVNQECMPTLYAVVSNLAQKLRISVPCMVIYTGSNKDTSCDVSSVSLYHNCGMVMMSKKLIEILSADQFEAMIAHELNHISHNHYPVMGPMIVVGNVLEKIPFVNRVRLQYCVVMSALRRYYELQADIGAARIIDSKQVFCDALEVLDALNGVKLNPEQSTADLFYRRFLAEYPSLDERKRYIAAA